MELIETLNELLIGQLDILRFLAVCRFGGIHSNGTSTAFPARFPFFHVNPLNSHAVLENLPPVRRLKVYVYISTLINGSFLVHTGVWL